MKYQKTGFTLIELVLVVAILAIIAVIGIGKFGDIRKDSARKANVASINNIQRAVNTKLAMTDKVTGMYNYCESLVDASCVNGPGDADAFSSGGYLWGGASWSATPYTRGIYAGIKEVGELTNKNGVSSGTSVSLEEARENNRGLISAANFGIRYLNESETAALKKAGMEILLYHNWMNSQSSVALTKSGRTLDEDLATRNGGPGSRPDMSAFFPIRLTNGVPVAVLDPAKSEKIYRAFGIDYPAKTDTFSSQVDYFKKGGLPRLLCVGLGRSSDITSTLFENPPRDNCLDKTYYRNYILVFKMLNGSGNTGYTVSFAGVIDPECNPSTQAIYNMDWAN